MATVINKEDYPGWRFYGKRFLTSREFTQFCTAVGLYNSHEWELEELERQRIMFPAVRLVLPDEYARSIWLIFNAGLDKVEIDDTFQAIHELDWAIRYPNTFRQDTDTPDTDLYHPIDQYWGRVDGLFKPSSQEYKPWEQYKTEIEYKGHTYTQSTVTHFYHYWQIYEFFQARKHLQNMYIDPAPVMIADMGQYIQSLNISLDAMSYFQFPYRARIANLLSDNEPDDDNLWRLSEDQLEEINASAASFAQETILRFELSEANLYEGLNALCRLHSAFELFERIRLSETVKSDIWRMTELIYYTFETPTEEISHRIGPVAGGTGDYIEMLFPNRRKQTHAKATRILKSLTQEHNRFAPNFAIVDENINEILAYLEKTELALFEYLLEQSNDAIYARHSWQTAEAFLQLKSFASFPETLMKVILINSADPAAILEFSKINNPGMGALSQIFFQKRFPTLWASYEPIGHRSSINAHEFMANLHYHIPLINHPGNEEAYLAASLSLSTCIRNFTSHLVVEDPNLLRGQYGRCIRAITTSIFLIWHAANKSGWIH